MKNSEQLINSKHDLSILNRRKALIKLSNSADRDWCSYLPCDIFVSKKPMLGCFYSVRVDVPNFPKFGTMTSYTQTRDQILVVKTFEEHNRSGVLVSFRLPTEAERANMRPTVKPPGTFVETSDFPLFE